jgi:hypothetical protein
MNTYQKRLLDEGTNMYVFSNSSRSNGGAKLSIGEGDSLVIAQDKDYHNTKYTIDIRSVVLSSVEFVKGPSAVAFAVQKDSSLAKEGKDVDQFTGIVDFDDRATAICLHFKNDLADPLTLTLHYRESNKEAFDAETENARAADLVKAMNVRVTVGESLINVMFSKASANVAKTVVALYMRDNQNNRNLMGTFPVEQGMMFKSISGLAFGLYSIKVTQVDTKDQLIAASDYVDVEIRKPNYGGKPTIGMW